MADQTGREVALFTIYPYGVDSSLSLGATSQVLQTLGRLGRLAGRDEKFAPLAGLLDLEGVGLTRKQTEELQAVAQALLKKGARKLRREDREFLDLLVRMEDEEAEEIRRYFIEQARAAKRKRAVKRKKANR